MRVMEEKITSLTTCQDLTESTMDDMSSKDAQLEDNVNTKFEDIDGTFKEITNNMQSVVQKHTAKVDDIDKKLHNLQETQQTVTVTMQSHMSELTALGCPHEKSIRSLCWKIFLNYLPPERHEWETVLQKQRNLYKQYIEEIVIIPGKKMKSKQSANGELEDHPLNPNPDSEWRETFRDNEQLVQIDKDCRRLCPDLSFFQQATDYPCEELLNASSNVETLRKRVEHCVLQSETVSKNRMGIYFNTVSKKRTQSEEYAVLPDGKEAHWEVVERILFLYAKLNPGLGYVQGMNEILGPIYYTLATDPDPSCREFAEADSFFCFTCLMGEIRDFFIKTLDDSQCGIGSKMSQLMDLVRTHDRPLWQRLEDQELKPQFYAFRWITLLLSQEFQLPEVLRIWDSLFADSNRFDFLIYVCCAMLLSVRHEILKKDFPSNMKLVQRMDAAIDLEQVLAKARELSQG